MRRIVLTIFWGTMGADSVAQGFEQEGVFVWLARAVGGLGLVSRWHPPMWR